MAKPELTAAAMPDTLDQYMTASDLIWALEHLNFTPQSSTHGATGVRHCLVSLDKHVARYLIDSLRARHGK